MSWDRDSAKHITSKGRVARKQEAEYRLANTFRDCFKIVKTALKGNKLYGAVEDSRTGEIFGCALTLEIEYGTVFWEVVTEDMGIQDYTCPESILDLLTPTDNHWAVEWRNKCRQRN